MMTTIGTNIYQEKKNPSILNTPIDTKGRKSSVTFDLPPTPNNEEEEEREQELLSPCTVNSPTIDICAHTVPDTMLVALFDRSTEMRGLVRHNKNYFTTLQQHLDTKWSRFENTLYCDRAKMSDQEWMNRITKALQSVPSLLEKFKELVGYMGDEEDDITSNSGDSEYFSSVDITLIRNYPNRISNESYPQFFINCKQFMQETEFNEFINLLSNTNRNQISDELWESKIYKQLHDLPNLLEQLQEIVAYEVDEDSFK